MFLDRLVGGRGRHMGVLGLSINDVMLEGGGGISGPHDQQC